METTPRNSSYFSIFFLLILMLFSFQIFKESSFIRSLHIIITWNGYCLFQKQIVNYTYERKKRLSIYRLCQCNKNVISHLDRVLLTPETFHWVIRRKMLLEFGLFFGFYLFQFVFHEFIILSKQNCQQYTYVF